jgi:uncharacterized RDD family membrane protein YckC
MRVAQALPSRYPPGVVPQAAARHHERMTQPPEHAGGRPAGDWSPDDQDSPPASAPPPSSWHFPLEPAPSPGDPRAQQGYGAQAELAGDAQPAGAQPQQGSQPPPYGAQPQYGTQPPYGAPQYGTQPQYGTPPPYGTSPHYGTPQYGAPQPYGTPYGGVYPAYAYPPAYAAGPEPDLAEWWRRLLARLIDGVLITVLMLPIAIPLFVRAIHQYQQVVNLYPDLNTPAAQAALSRADGKLVGAWLIIAACYAVIIFLYDAIQHGIWGQTVGKRALGTRVVSARDRSKITGGQAAGRAAMYTLVPLVPLAGSIYSLLDALWLLWDRRRQCLHDKPAHTIVIKTRFEPPGTSQPGAPW